MLSVIQDYLKNRKQYVKNGDVESTVLDVLIGVPQGSVLGPLLFIIFINDIVNTSSMSAALFADDAVFITEEEHVKKLQQSLNNGARNIFNWLIANKLTLNFGKTKYMIFHNKRDPKIIKQVKKFKLNIYKQILYQTSHRI